MIRFQLLKQTFPISQYDRYCDGYVFLMENTSKEEREKLGIEDDKLQRIIKSGEKYLYRVGKEGDNFKSMCISLSNFQILRKNYFKLQD